MSSIVKVWILLLGLVLATGCRSAAGGESGPQVYQSVCATCHGADGTPTAAMIARLNVRDLSSKELRARVTPALVEAQVRKGSTNKLMPSFEGALTDAQIKDVAEYVASPSFPKQ
jgi:mono/diheme cytochrome c family protein